MISLDTCVIKSQDQPSVCKRRIQKYLQTGFTEVDIGHLVCWRCRHGGEMYIRCSGRERFTGQTGLLAAIYVPWS
jgi:hypothetical protein